MQEKNETNGRNRFEDAGRNAKPRFSLTKNVRMSDSGYGGTSHDWRY